MPQLGLAAGRGFAKGRLGPSARLERNIATRTRTTSAVEAESEQLPPVPPPIGRRRSNAGPRGAHADLLQRVHEVFGPLPVIDASEPLTLHPLIDAEGAEPRDPGNCLLAHCAARELGARTVAFFRGTTYLDRIGPDGERRIERYMNSAAARRLIVAFDSGTQPITANTTLTLLPPYKQFTIADKRERSRNSTRQRLAVLGPN